MIKIQPEEVRTLSQYVYSLCGVHLDETKAYLLENRLAALLQESSCASFSEFYLKARSDPTRNLPRKIVDAVTTGETSFFRDNAPFELFQFKLLPELIDRRKKTTPTGKPIPLRIWSAACSSGQEVYTTAIILQETLGNLSNYNIHLLGTDISDQAIARASYGVFSKMEMDRGLPPDKIQRYFTSMDKGWKIRDELRGVATFKKINLMDDFSFLGNFDIIFCRNVAIYFTEADKALLFSKLGRALTKDGALIIGSTEALTGLAPQFESMRYLRSVYYRLK
ncbi:MAG TPA: protein-glutamate O-methyltransferase CheR [Anaerolineales bacterium]|nr:protein-glutamate O-methyltransferase CheR [Anaerolineales bacterium]HNA89431.1 protein-glutamate O-methyltransferase CheR [Anaerolineales bacterium]